MTIYPLNSCLAILGPITPASLPQNRLPAHSHHNSNLLEIATSIATVIR